MKLLSHFPTIGVSNTYIVGPRDGGDALLIDPGRFDVDLLNIIEDSGFYIRTVLVSHDHRNHIQGLRTLLKVYDARVIAGSAFVDGIPADVVSGGDSLNASGIDVDVIDVIGHSPDSRVYRCGPYLFTGDVLSAGRVGSSPTDDGLNLLIDSIRKQILPLDEDLLILPGHGPPTTVAVEREWNPDFRTPVDS